MKKFCVAFWATFDHRSFDHGFFINPESPEALVEDGSVGNDDDENGDDENGDDENDDDENDESRTISVFVLLD